MCCRNVQAQDDNFQMKILGAYAARESEETIAAIGRGDGLSCELAAIGAEWGRHQH